MAGKIIADIIEAPYDSIRMNVGNVTVLTANNSGLTYTPTGNVNINVGSTVSLTLGNVTVSNLITANGGIKFPATQVASGDANTLDDYEEGTWTPSLTSETGSFTSVNYTDLTGRYTKIGRLVLIDMLIGWNGWTVGTASGNLQVGNLPFSAAGSNSLFSTQTYLVNWQNSGTITGQSIGSATNIFFRVSQSNGDWDSVRVSSQASSGEQNYIRLSGCYNV